MRESQSVALCGCADYQRQHVEEAVAKAVDLLGGWDGFIQPGMRVLIKPNLVLNAAPERCATTHPEVIAAICRAVTAAGATPVIGDSPGGPFTAAWLSAVYNGCGMNQAAKASGAQLNRDTSETTVAFPEGKAMRTMPMITAATSADAIINVAKLKTHGLTTYSGSCKNLFGLIPGLLKMECHERYPLIGDFAEMLVDIAEAAKPTLNIIDGIMGMEGAGPTHGTPRAFGVLIASPSPHTADVVGAGILGLTIDQVPTLCAARERGLIDEIEILGEDTGRYAQSGVAIPDTPESTRLMERVPILRRLFPKLVRARPQLVAERCVGCGICARSCPKKVIVMKDNRPRIRRRDCIKCLCCEELCPKAAMISRRPLLLRVLR